MTEKMVNGILFIIAGIGSIAIYMVLGETGLLGKVHTEKIAAYALVTIPLAFMMTRNVARNPFIDTGLLIIVVGLTMGLVGDAINSTKISAESNLIAEAVGMTAWSIEVPVGAGAVSLSESFKHEKVNNNVAVNKAIYLIMDLYYLICKCRAIPTLA